MCAAVFVLFRLAGLISHANRVLTDYGDRASTLIERAQAAVDRTNEQLARTDSITASMDEVTANMAELSGHVSALAGLARGISARPRHAAAAGLRVRLRRPPGGGAAAARPGRRRRPRRGSRARPPYRQAAVPGGPDALPAGGRSAAPAVTLPGPRSRSGRGRPRGGTAMIRRLFWADRGRAARRDRLPAGQPAGARGQRGRAAGRDTGEARDAGAGSPGRRSGAAQFARDVREGMELYTDRHPRLAGRTLEGQQARARRLPTRAAAARTPASTMRRMAVDGVGRDRPPFP